MVHLIEIDEGEGQQLNIVGGPHTELSLEHRFLADPIY